MEEREPETSEQLLAFRHHLQDDHAFLKILGENIPVELVWLLYLLPTSSVLSGHCYHDCRSGQMVECKILFALTSPLSLSLSPPPAIWVSVARSGCQVLN